MIPFVDLKAGYQAIREDVHTRINDVLEHGKFIMGPEVAELETRLAEFVGTKHCIAAGNGTDTLLISLMALGIGPGDEVITTPFTFIATGEMIMLAGAKPVFVDIKPKTYNIDVELIEAAITPNTRAIMPVSLYGQCADMDAINAIAAEHGLTVIEDAAQSFGAEYKGRKSCALSTIGSTSFFPSKPLGCYGDGGALFTDDDDLATAMREIRVHGQDRRYHHSRIGVNSRLDSLQAAVLLAKLGRFEWEVGQRQVVADRYLSLLADVPADLLEPPEVMPDCTSVFAQFTISTPNRDALLQRLKEAGIATAVHYPIPLHLQQAFAPLRGKRGDHPVAESAAQRVLSLPMHAYLTAEQQKQIVEAVIGGRRRRRAGR